LWAAAGPAVGQVIWLTVDRDDQQDRFWAYVCAGLGRVGPPTSGCPGQGPWLGLL